MSEVPIGQVKRDISELVNRVAYGGERIVLTSRGKPKAALVSIEDYQRLEQENRERILAEWNAWLAECQQLTDAILQRRQGQPVDVEQVWQAVEQDWETRDDQILGR